LQNKPNPLILQKKYDLPSTTKADVAGFRSLDKLRDQRDLTDLSGQCFDWHENEVRGLEGNHVTEFTVTGCPTAKALNWITSTRSKETNVSFEMLTEHLPFFHETTGSPGVQNCKERALA